MLSRYLTEDHHRLDSLLVRALADGRFDVGAFEQLRAGLLRHIGIEEKLLFAEARRLDARELLPTIERLRIEHAALVSLLMPTPDRALALEIESLLRRHNAREEGDAGLYRACEALPGFDADALEAKARAVNEPPLAAHFDGRGVFRTAADALAAQEQAFARRKRRDP